MDKFVEKICLEKANVQLKNLQSKDV